MSQLYIFVPPHWFHFASTSTEVDVLPRNLNGLATRLETFCRIVGISFTSSLSLPSSSILSSLCCRFSLNTERLFFIFSTCESPNKCEKPEIRSAYSSKIWRNSVENNRAFLWKARTQATITMMRDMGTTQM
jgi:hypothetical protein